MPQGILSYHKLRQEAASCKRWNPDWSYSKIAKHLGCSHSFVSRWVDRNKAYGHVDDKPRSGRPPKANAAAHKQLVMAAQHPECRTAADIAAKAERDHQQHFSTSLVKRVLRKNGFQHLSPQARPILSAQNMVNRVRYARAILRRNGSSKRSWLNTDSKYFHLHKMGTPLRRWCKAADRGTVGRPKHSIAAHVYMGISYWGVTKLKFVTGTHKQASKFVNPKTKRLHTGVGSQEYTEVLSQLFVPEGNRLFQGAGKWADKWQLQQDNARPHTTDANKAYIEANVPRRKFPAWPANSPDLSPIENMWAWMEGKLHKEYKPNNIEELKECLEQIRQSIPSVRLGSSGLLIAMVLA